jgi:hypothetical protein
MNTNTAAIGSMPFTLLMGNTVPSNYSLFSEVITRLTTETGEYGKKRCTEPMNVLFLVVAMVEEVW